MSDVFEKGYPSYDAVHREETIDKNKIYWIWDNGNQYQVSWCDYTQSWSMIQNNSGKAM